MWAAVVVGPEPAVKGSDHEVVARRERLGWRDRSPHNDGDGERASATRTAIIFISQGVAAERRRGGRARADPAPPAPVTLGGHERHPDLDVLARRVIDAQPLHDAGERSTPTAGRGCRRSTTRRPATATSTGSPPRGRITRGNLAAPAQRSRSSFSTPRPRSARARRSTSPAVGESYPATTKSTPSDPEAFRTTAGALHSQPDELRGDARLRLYVARLTACEVHVPGRDPVHGRGVDVRLRPTPRSAETHIAPRPGAIGSSSSPLGRRGVGNVEDERVGHRRIDELGLSAACFQLER